MGKKISEEICENMGTKIKETRYKGKMEMVIYRVRIPRKNAEDGLR